jgi:hypothetical protein
VALFLVITILLPIVHKQAPAAICHHGICLLFVRNAISTRAWIMFDACEGTGDLAFLPI